MTKILKYFVIIGYHKISVVKVGKKSGKMKKHEKFIKYLKIKKD